jgi:RND family efflux transporter MFP subunit
LKRRFLLFLIAVVVVGVLLQLWRRDANSGTSEKRRSSQPTPVETAAVHNGLICDVGIFTGTFEPKSQFIVAPKVAGWLKKLLVDVGDTVERNQVIAILDDEEFTQQLEQAKAELEVAKANAANCATDLDIARREYERAKVLRDKQIASASELDVSEAQFNASQTKYKVSVAQQTQKEAAQKAAEVRLSYTKVQAFWEEGDETRVVGERFVDEGALLQINQPIVSVLENDPLTAVVYVIEKDYPKVVRGQQALVSTDAYLGRTFAGTIVRIAPLLKESSRQARVEIEVPNPTHLLKPGMFLRTEVEFARHENATLIPVAAVVRRKDREGVFVVDEKNLKARFVAITTGIKRGEEVEVIEPQISGLVVTMGNHLLEDGSDIQLATSEPHLQNQPASNATSTGDLTDIRAGDSR